VLRFRIDGIVGQRHGCRHDEDLEGRKEEEVVKWRRGWKCN